GKDILVSGNRLVEPEIRRRVQGVQGRTIGRQGALQCAVGAELSLLIRLLPLQGLQGTAFKGHELTDYGTDVQSRPDTCRADASHALPARCSVRILQARISVMPCLAG